MNPEPKYLEHDHWCSSCERYLAPALFGHFTARKNGGTYRQAYCRECHRERARRYAKALAGRSDAQLLAVRPLRKICTRCDRTLPADNFLVDRTKADGLQTFCRDCQRVNQREYKRNKRRRQKQQSLVGAGPVEA